jgi:hypothetical protein
MQKIQNTQTLLASLITSLVLVSSFSACTGMQTKRDVASEAASSDHVRVATLTSADGKRFVILGVDHSDEDGPTINLADLKTADGRHFSGSDIGSVDPKFLITVNALGVQKVRSFGLERFGHVQAVVYSEASKDAVRNSYERLDHPENANVLPAEFLDVPRAEESLIEATVIDAILEAGEFAPAGGELAALLKNLTVEAEDARRAEAGYLLNWIEAALHNQIPELKSVFSEKELRDIGSSITLRYNLENKYAGLFVGNKHKETFFDKTERNSLAVESTAMQALMDLANKEELIVEPLNSEFAFVFYDDRHIHLDDHWREYFKSFPAPKSHPRMHISENSSHLVPVGLFSLRNSHRPTPLMDLKNPGRIGSVPRLVKLVDLASDLAFSYFPLDGVMVAASVGVYGIRFGISKSDITIFDDRMMSYASLQALMDAGYVKFDFSGVLVHYLYRNASELGINSPQLKSIGRGLLSKNKNVSEDAARELVSLDARGEAEEGFLYGVRSSSEIQENKKVVIQRLKNWLQNPSEQ